MNEFPADDKVTGWTAEAMRLAGVCEDEKVSVNRTPSDPEEWKCYYAAREALRAHLAELPAVAKGEGA